ncbi:hypothetical protein J4206_06335 [Candidatus Woesearchaeota archaeon]|nr:hypothetical protein [Candidatus Woesearchaeota archaeon]
MKRITDGILLQQEKDNKTIDNLYGSCIKVMDNFIGNEMKFMSVDPKKLSDKALVSKLNEVCTAAKHVWDHVLFIDAFDIISDKIISSSFDSYNNSHNFAGSKITNKEIEILTLPDELAFTQRERLSLLKIAAAAKEGKNIEKAIAEHQQQFFWYKSNYSVIEILDESYFMQKLDAVLKNESAEQIKKDIMSFESYEKRIKQQKEDISKKHNLNSSLKETIYFFTRLTLLRDHRKEWVLKSHVLIKHLAAEISKRAKIPLHELEYLSYWEIESIAQLKKMKNLNERIKDSAWVADESYGYAGHFGKEAVQINGFLQKRIVTEINALQGVAASSGYAKGNVKIINRVQEFSKMQKGDILVSSNTRPEYVPIMKLAAAIITDEGGITCHAAIVSRELKIPCIVGTQAATKVLKDGMVVEVDAEKGVVKIVKE